MSDRLTLVFPIGFVESVPSVLFTLLFSACMSSLTVDGRANPALDYNCPTSSVWLGERGASLEDL